MLNMTHSKWLPAFKTQPIANRGPNPQTTTRVIPTTTTTATRRTETPIIAPNQNQTTTKQFIQLNAANSSRSGRTILVKRQRPQPHKKPIFLRNFEILSPESLTQLLNQNLLLNHQAQLLNQLNLKVTKNRTQATLPTEKFTQNQTLFEEEQELSETPIYSIISVPFLARSFLPAPSIKQVKLKTNGLVKLKQTKVNANGTEDRTIIHGLKENHILAHSNSLDQQQQQKSNKNQLNITSAKVLRTAPINLNTTTTRTPITTASSATMMGVQLPGNEFQDMNGALQIAAAEELMAPVCFDDYFIETNNNSDFDTNKGTYKVDGFNEMTIYQNEDFQNQQQRELNCLKLFEEQGEEEVYNILRPPYSQELIGLPLSETLGSESLFTQQFELYNNEMIANSEDSNTSSQYLYSPGSPLPTQNDCIAISELHRFNPTEENCDSSMHDNETACRLELPQTYSNEHSPEASNSTLYQNEDIEQIIKQIKNSAAELPEPSLTLKRHSAHLSYSATKKARLHIPIGGGGRQMDTVCENGLLTKTPDTPEVCDMVDTWLTEDTSINYSHSPSPQWSRTSYTPDNIPEPYSVNEFTFENPASHISSYTFEEPSFATPSPSNSSTCTYNSTNPNSPAFSSYGGGSGSGGTTSSRKPRGRPPKQHSDRPDPEIWARMTEAERKRYEDRCKNNEASRQSRQKNKAKQQLLEEEERNEEQKNIELVKRKRKLDLVHSKLKTILSQKFNSQN